MRVLVLLILVFVGCGKDQIINNDNIPLTVIEGTFTCNREEEIGDILFPPKKFKICVAMLSVLRPDGITYWFELSGDVDFERGVFHPMDWQYCGRYRLSLW